MLERHPVRRQVLIIASMVLVPLLMAIAWSASRTRLERQTDVRGEAAATGTLAVALLDRSLDTLDVVAALLARDRAVIELKGVESHRLFAIALAQQPLLTRIVLTDAEGAPASSSPESAMVPSRQAVVDPEMGQVIRSGLPLIGRPRADPAAGRPTLVLGYPVRDEGALVGALGMGVNLSLLQSELGRIPLPAGSLVTVTDGAGVVSAINMAARLRHTRDAIGCRMQQDRKMNATLHSLQRQVRQERLAAGGLLASGVAHELNNPPQAILGTSEFLERRPELSRDVLGEIAFVKKQSGRAREIIRNLSRFSAQPTHAAAAVQFNRSSRKSSRSARLISRARRSRSRCGPNRRDRCEPTSPKSSRSP